jgi:hypothetical protein
LVLFFKKEQKKKTFFFEKKKQKTFDFLAALQAGRLVGWCGWVILSYGRVGHTSCSTGAGAAHGAADFIDRARIQ